MAYRIIMKDLERCVSRMNTVAGRPQGFEKGSFMLGADYGHYYITEKLECGGERKVIDPGTAREVYQQACAWIAGYDLRKGGEGSEKC